MKRLCHLDLFTLRGNAGQIISISFSPDGKRLAAANGGTAKIWDATSGKELLDPGASKQINSVCFSPDGKRLATTSYDKTAKIWDATSGQEFSPYAGT